jgi:hypothetical protein
MKGNKKLEKQIKEVKKRISKEQYNKEIDEAIARIRSGKFVTHEQVMKEMKKL